MMRTNEPAQGVPVVSARTNQAVRNMLELAASASGTAPLAQVPGYRVAGKTGTAQSAPGQPPHAWFVGVAPASTPGGAEVAVAALAFGEEGADRDDARSSSSFRRAAVLSLLAP